VATIKTLLEKVKSFFLSDPTSANTIVFCSLFLTVFGACLLNVPPHAYHQQREFFTIETWAWFFMVGGVLKLLRLFLQERWVISLIVHFSVTLVINVWALTYLIGAINGSSVKTAAVAYVFIAIIFNCVPLIPVINNRARR
jgi:hypothetical protein